MKKFLLSSCVLVLLLSCEQKTEILELEENYENGMVTEDQEAVNEGSEPDSVLRHVVYFSFKEGTSQEDITKVVDAFRDLQNKIPGIQSFEWGVNSSPENINRGLTHAFTLTFYSDEDRDNYLPHPDHKAFGEVLTPHLGEVLVVDYWTRK